MESKAEYGVAAAPWQEAGLAQGAGRPMFCRIGGGVARLVVEQRIRKATGLLSWRLHILPLPVTGK
jgi:hypothetical protein